MAEQKVFTVDKKLPTIIVPREKARVFTDWYKTDIYKEKTIPLVFEEGYLTADIHDLIEIKTPSILSVNNMKDYQHQMNVKDNVYKIFGEVIVHFKMINSTSICLNIFSNNNHTRINHAHITVEELASGHWIDTLRNAMVNNSTTHQVVLDLCKDNTFIPSAYVEERLREFGSKLVPVLAQLLVSTIWYLASIKDAKREQLTVHRSVPATTHSKHKYKSHGKRTITAPIYDLANSKDIEIEKLTTKKNSWKISCRFQVRGHYRHYKSGKTIFVKPFEKGKGFDIKPTEIILNPVCETNVRI